MRGQMSIGNLIIIISFFSKVLNSITCMSDFTKEYQDSKVSYIRLKEILSQRVQTNGKIEVNSIQEIECKNLSIYRDKDLIINDFSYTFKRGNIYCLVGENGSGKSTLT